MNMNDIQKVEYNGIIVLTTQQIAEAYETSTDTITKNFNRNKDRYKEGKHYICLKGRELKEFKANRQIDLLPNVNTLYLWTEKGAFLHAKSLNTDIAWEVYDKLVDNYFKKKEDFFEGISPELKAVLVVDKRVTAVEQKVDHLENTMNIDYAQQKQLKNFASEIVINALGGKEARAYRYKAEDGTKISSQCFSRFWHDFNDYFNINAYANLPRVRFNEALQYINRWQPPTNMQLEIGRINREIA